MICGYKIFVVVLTLSPHFIFESQAQRCEYKQEMESQKEYFIFNKEYPGYYPGGTLCDWIGFTPVEGNVAFQCSDVNVGSSSSCSNDYLSIYIERNGAMQEVDRFCGGSPIFATYKTRTIYIRLISTRSGRFSCVLSSFYYKPCNCGLRQHRRIVGGTETQMLEYPWMSAIVRRGLDPEDWQWCGASIISKRYALSAAHCKYHADRSYQLLVGTHNTSSRGDTQFSRLYEIERFVVHPNFNLENNYINDVMVIRTTQDIVFSLYVAPICLPIAYQSATFEGAALKVLGYGTDSFTGIKTDVLHEVDLSGMANPKCADLYKPEPVRSTELCTYGVGKDSCQYDSGGPVMYSQNGRYFIVGLVSHGVACASSIKPGVNTRVTSYLKWIVDATGETFCTP